MGGVVFMTGAEAVLALVVAAGAIVIALVNWLAAQRAAELRDLLRDAESRAHAAETALAEIRMKRSLAVSKGNRRRAELERARIRETTEAVRVAVQRKKQPQGSLPL